jgi:hypothetical protein
MVSTRVRMRGTAMALTAVGLLLFAAQPVGAASTTFGAKLTTNTQPSNAPSNCDHQLTGQDGTDKCTWIEAAAYSSSANKAPKNGQINALKLISCTSGKFTLFIAHYNPATTAASVVTQGPTISYSGHCSNTSYTVQKFNISPVTVHTGDYLAIRASKVGFLRCDSGGTRTSLYKPPLTVGGGTFGETDHSGCYLLLQAVYAA